MGPDGISKCVTEKKMTGNNLCVDPLLRPFLTLVRYETAVWNAVEVRLRTVDGAVSLGRHGILALADEVEGLRVQDVADRLTITVGAASRLVDRMEADGLLARRPHPQDRRSSCLSLTDAGASALAVTAPAIDTALADVLGSDGAARLVAAAELLGAATEAGR